MLVPQSQNILIVQANTDNLLTATVTGKRKREVGLVVPAKFTAFTQELKNANILKRELNEGASRYTHFKLKNISIDENKFPLPAYSVFLSSYGNTQISAAPELRRFFEGGAY